MHTVKPRTAQEIATWLACATAPYGISDRAVIYHAVSLVLAEHEAKTGVMELAIETLSAQLRARCEPGEEDRDTHVTSCEAGAVGADSRAPGSTAPTTEQVEEDVGWLADRYNLAQSWRAEIASRYRDLAADRDRLAADRDSQQRVAIQRETERDALARRIEELAKREPTPEEIEAVHFARRLGGANYGDSVFRAVRDMLLATPASEPKTTDANVPHNARKERTNERRDEGRPGDRELVHVSRTDGEAEGCVRGNPGERTEHGLRDPRRDAEVGGSDGGAAEAARVRDDGECGDRLRDGSVGREPGECQRAPGSTAPTTEEVERTAEAADYRHGLPGTARLIRALAADRDRLLAGLEKMMDLPTTEEEVEIDDLRQERDRLAAALDLARAEHDRSNAQRDALVEARNSAIADRDRLAQEVKDAHHARQWINNAHLETSASRDALSRRIEAMRVREPTADDLIQFKQSWNDHSRNPYVKAWLHVRDALLATPEAGDAE